MVAGAPGAVSSAASGLGTAGTVGVGAAEGELAVRQGAHLALQGGDRAGRKEGGGPGSAVVCWCELAPKEPSMELRSPLGLLSVGSNCARVLVSSAGRDGGQEMARVLFAILLGVVVAACASPRTTEWAGAISGGGCYGFSIEITIDRDGVMVGKATHHARGTLWDVSGMVHKTGFVYMRLRVHDPQEEARIRARGYNIPWVTLEGHLTGSSLSIAQPSSRACDPPRSGVLKRL